MGARTESGGNQSKASVLGARRLAGPIDGSNGEHTGRGFKPTYTGRAGAETLGADDRINMATDYAYPSSTY